MVVAPDDWRRSGQESFLKGVELKLETFQPPRPSWDHEHCEFCFATISTYAGDLAQGYATPDRQHWICVACFADFREEFGFVVRGDTG
jgi:hypothetical protein